MAQTRRCDWTLATVLPGNLPGFVAYLSPDNLAETSIFAAPNAGGAAYDDGRDIRAYAVIDGEPVRIPVEIHFNRYAQIGRIWARFPNFQLSPTLRLEWGDPDLPAVPVADTYGRNAVWQDYALVIHATEDGTQAEDSTGKSASVTVEGGGLAAATVAHPGGLAGWKFDGVDDYMRVPSRTGLHAARPFTVQAWIAATSPAGDDFIFHKRPTDVTNQGWGFRRVGGATTPLRYTTYGVADYNASANTAWGTGWWSVAFTAAGTTGTFFRNGAQLGTTVTLGATPPVLAHDLLIGRFLSNVVDTLSDANMSEWRITERALSAEWLAAEYANQQSPTTFWGSPVETEIGGGGGTHTYNDTLTEAVTAGDALSASVAAAVEIAEAITAGDSYAASLLAAAAVVESLAAGDSLASSASYTVALTEVVALAEVMASGNVYAVSLSEALTLSDGMAQAVVFAETLSEAVAVADGISEQAQYASTLEELVALSDELAASGGADVAFVGRMVTSTALPERFASAAVAERWTAVALPRRWTSAAH